LNEQHNCQQDGRLMKFFFHTYRNELHTEKQVNAEDSQEVSKKLSFVRTGLPEAVLREQLLNRPSVLSGVSPVVLSGKG
jgi:hypothetical protein